MNTLTLDTLGITRKLEKSGMPRKAAEANGYEQCQKCPGWPEE